MCTVIDQAFLNTHLDDVKTISHNLLACFIAPLIFLLDDTEASIDSCMKTINMCSAQFPTEDGRGYN